MIPIGRAGEWHIGCLYYHCCTFITVVAPSPSGEAMFTMGVQMHPQKTRNLSYLCSSFATAVTDHSFVTLHRAMPWRAAPTASSIFCTVSHLCRATSPSAGYVESPPPRPLPLNYGSFLNDVWLLMFTSRPIPLIPPLSVVPPPLLLLPPPVVGRFAPVRLKLARVCVNPSLPPSSFLIVFLLFHRSSLTVMAIEAPTTCSLFAS
jgi:hypothetical protein